MGKHVCPAHQFAELNRKSKAAPQIILSYSCNRSSKTEASFKQALNVRQENHRMTRQDIWNHCDQLLVSVAAIPDRGMPNQFLENLKGNTLLWKFIVFIILM